MEAKEVLYIMRATAPSATIEDAAAFLALCNERGLTPFTEASPLVVDYTKRDGTHVHSLAIKEHYAVAERWAQQSGGYTIRLREIVRNQAGDISARIGIVSNRDYAAVGQLCARVPGANFKEELAGFMVIGEAILTAQEMSGRQPPKGKSWEWLAEKRARESALLQKFGREPSQSRQMYTAALAADPRAAAALLYGDEQQVALPAPTQAQAPAPAPTPVVAPVVEVEGDVTEVAPAEPAPATPTPAQNGAREWPFPVLQAVLQARLSDGTLAAKKALALSNLSADATPDQAVAWMRVYRAARDEGMTPQDAAQRANGA